MYFPAYFSMLKLYTEAFYPRVFNTLFRVPVVNFIPRTNRAINNISKQIVKNKEYCITNRNVITNRTHWNRDFKNKSNKHAIK